MTINPSAPRRNLKEVARLLQEHDQKVGLSARAHELARQRGLFTDSMTASAGRTLSYYSGAIEQMSNRLGKFSGKHFLHIASSTGVLGKFLENMRATAVNLDSDKVYSQIAKKLGNQNSVRADATRPLPFASNSFNCLITDHFVFAKYKLIDMHPEHEGSQAVLKEAARVLRPDGIFVINAVDYKLPLEDLIQISSKYFKKVEPYAYVQDKIFIPGLVLSLPKKE